MLLLVGESVPGLRQRLYFAGMASFSEEGLALAAPGVMVIPGDVESTPAAALTSLAVRKRRLPGVAGWAVAPG